MRQLLAKFGVILAALLSVGSEPGRKPAIGDRVEAPEFKDIRSLRRSLDDFGPKQAYVVIAIRGTCPLARKYLPILGEMEKKYRGKGVQFLALGVDAEESIAEIAAMAIDSGIEFPVGKEDGSWTRAVGWVRTPEAVVIDSERRLRYRGRIDDQIRIGGSKPAASKQELAEALDAILAGQVVATAETPVDGCAIPGKIEASGPVPTFYENVEPIIQKHCQDCHRPNTEAPFALLNYREAAIQAETIAEVVDDRRMPPWYAVHDEGLSNRRVLDDRERETLIRWARGGMPKGDPAKRPEPRKLPTEGWRIGEPDRVISMIGSSEIPSTGYVDYRYVIFPTVFFEDTWVQSVEIRADNPRVIHHANLGYVKAGEKFSDENFITGKVPGGDPMKLEDGLAYLIPAGSVLAMQVHYTTTGKPERCKISVGLKYPRVPVKKRLYHTEVTTSRFAIPAGAPSHKVSARRTLPFDASLLGVVAHMHLRATDMDFLARKPDGTTERLVLVPNYNFDWQMAYRWEPGTKKLPKGTILESVGHYDNSAFNPFNPDPAATVRFGTQTFQEMFICYSFYTRDDEDLGLKIDPQSGKVQPRIGTEGARQNRDREEETSR